MYPETIYINENKWYRNEFENSVEYQKVKKVRSNAQNRALHKWFTQIAEILNETGQQRYNEMGIPSIYTSELLKNDYWKPLQKQLFDINSTRDMTGTMLNNLIDSFVLWLAESKGVKAPPFPDKHQLMFELDKKNVK